MFLSFVSPCLSETHEPASAISEKKGEYKLKIRDTFFSPGDQKNNLKKSIHML